MQMPKKPKLLEQVRQRIRTKHDSIRTEEAYVQWVKRFVLFHQKRHPAEMGGKDGDNLICVRYRYDAENNRMYKTVELIIENLPWQQNTRKIRKDKIVDLRIKIEEVEMRNRVKLAGGKWNRNKQVWQLLYETAQQLGLTDRIVCDK